MCLLGELPLESHVEVDKFSFKEIRQRFGVRDNAFHKFFVEVKVDRANKWGQRVRQELDNLL